MRVGVRVRVGMRVGVRVGGEGGGWRLIVEDPSGLAAESGDDGSSYTNRLSSTHIICLRALCWILRI